MIGAVAIAGAVAFNINAGLKSGTLSDIALANIEALARNEGGDDDPEYWDPYGLVDSSCCGSGCYSINDRYFGWVGCARVQFEFCCYGK